MATRNADGADVREMFGALQGESGGAMAILRCDMCGARAEVHGR